MRSGSNLAHTVNARAVIGLAEDVQVASNGVEGAARASRVDPGTTKAAETVARGLSEASHGHTVLRAVSAAA